MFGFENLEVWQKSIEFSRLIYEFTRSFPAGERFGLTSQMRRASVSISSNIAEGSSRSSKKDFARFVQLAYGSLMETVSQSHIAMQQEFLVEDRMAAIRSSAEELARMLSGLKRSLDKKP